MPQTHHAAKELAAEGKVELCQRGVVVEGGGVKGPDPPVTQYDARPGGAAEER